MWVRGEWTALGIKQILFFRYKIDFVLTPPLGKKGTRFEVKRNALMFVHQLISRLKGFS